MPSGEIVIVDLTGEAARVSAFPAARGGAAAVFDLPARAAVRAMLGAPEVVCGREAAGAAEGPDTLVFDNLLSGLPEVEDPEVQGALARGLWDALERGLAERGAHEGAARTPGYVIHRRAYSPGLLDVMRGACAGSARLRLAGFCHETTALLVGALRSAEFRRARLEIDPGAHAVVCLFVTPDEGDAEVICFEHERDDAGRQRARVLDHLRAPLAELASRLKGCDWLGSFVAVVSLEGRGLGAGDRALLDGALGAVPLLLAQSRVEAGVESLRSDGAEFVARTSLGQRARARQAEAEEYLLEAAFNVGVRVNQNSFWPVLTKERCAVATSYPLSAATPFRLRGRAGDELHFGLYCGYSDRVAEATFLGRVVLDGRKLTTLSAGGTLAVAAVRMDSPGGGEFGLFLSNGETMGKFNFTLPGLVA